MKADRRVSAHINFYWERLSASTTCNHSITAPPKRRGPRRDARAPWGSAAKEMLDGGAKSRNENTNCKISFHFCQHQKLLTSWAVGHLCVLMLVSLQLEYFFPRLRFAPVDGLFLSVQSFFPIFPLYFLRFSALASGFRLQLSLCHL